MKFSHYALTTSRPIITPELWNETNVQYLHDISFFTKSHESPTISSFWISTKPHLNLPPLPRLLVTMAEERLKHIPVAGGTGKHGITLTVTKSMSNELFLLHVIWKEELKGVFHENLGTTKNLFFLIMKVTASVFLPYTEKVKQDSNLPKDEMLLLIWDSFMGQKTVAVKKQLSQLNIFTVTIPKKCTSSPASQPSNIFNI